MPLPPRDIRPDGADDSGDVWFPETESERDAVRQQLARILASDGFCNSKRYPNLLRHIVEETLAGQSSLLKERTLGVQVFGRDPSYDTNLDPVVRTSAAQVRHRMAQYYAEPDHENEIRIELLPGSYVPRFSRSGDRLTVVAMPAHVASAVVAQKRWPKWLAVAGSPVIVAALAWSLSSRWLAPDAVAAFWGPVWDNSAPLTICVPGNFPRPENPTQTSGVALPDREPPKPLSIHNSLGLNSITWPDATVTYTTVGFIQAHGHEYRVRRERDLLFSDLRAGPALMIGGPYNNQWMARLASRYRFTHKSQNGEHWISDSQNPSRRDWKVRPDAPYATFDMDYGMVSRVWDPTTGHWVLVASGIASYGTVAAGEFLTEPEHLKMLARQAPVGWERKNVQVVFQTRVLNGNAGPPQILAIHVW